MVESCDVGESGEWAPQSQSEGLMGCKLARRLGGRAGGGQGGLGGLGGQGGGLGGGLGTTAHVRNGGSHVIHGFYSV